MPADREILSKTPVVAASTFVSRILGLVRDVVTAHLFGTSGLMDIFLLAFTVPNLFRRLFGEGALSVVFIPVFTREIEDPEADERRLFNVVLTSLAALLGAVTFVGWVVCAMALLFGRPSGDGVSFWVLLAVMLPYLPLICLAALQGAALNVKRHFLVPALGPALLNVCLILAAWLYSDRFGVLALSVGVLISGVLQYAIQLPLLWRLRLYVRPVWDLGHAGLRQIARQMLPVAAGIAVFQVNVLADRLIAKFCVPEEGAISALHYGNRLMQFPLGVLGMALATAALPAFSRLAAKEDHGGLIRASSQAVRAALFMALPCMAAFAALSVPMMRVLFERGKFDAESTARSATVLFYYAAGLWAFCSVHVLARAFYALEDVRTPVRIATMMVGLNVLLNLTLVWPMKEAGLALASSISSAGNAILLLVLLRRRLGRLEGRAISICAAKSITAALLSGVGGYLAFRHASQFLSEFAARHGAFWGDAVSLAVALAAAGAAFLLAAWVLRAGELRELWRAVFPQRAEPGDA